MPAQTVPQENSVYCPYSLFGQGGWILAYFFTVIYGPRPRIGQYRAIVIEQPWSINRIYSHPQEPAATHLDRISLIWPELPGCRDPSQDSLSPRLRW